MADEKRTPFHQLDDDLSRPAQTGLTLWLIEAAEPSAFPVSELVWHPDHADLGCLRLPPPGFLLHTPWRGGVFSDVLGLS